MARVFASASSQYLSRTSAVVASTTCTISLWFRTSGTGTMGGCGMYLPSAGADRWQTLQFGSQSVLARSYNGTTSVTASSGTYSTVAWNHGAAVFASATSRIAYVDAVAGAENTTNVNVTGLTHTDIGRINWASGSQFYFDGRMAFVAIWTAALSADEIASLGQKLNGVPCGVHPTRIRPESLVACWPLGGFDGDHEIGRAHV